MPSRQQINDWFLQYNEPIKRWLKAKRRLDDALLEDMAQEVFVRLLKVPEDVLVEHPQTYLFAIASNVANDWHGLAAQRKVHHALDEPQEDRTQRGGAGGFADTLLHEVQETLERNNEVERTVEQEILTDQMRRAMGGLSKRQQRILLMKHDEELTYEQIAKALDITMRMVLRTLSQCYANLRGIIAAEAVMSAVVPLYDPNAPGPSPRIQARAPVTESDYWANLRANREWLNTDETVRVLHDHGIDIKASTIRGWRGKGGLVELRGELRAITKDERTHNNAHSTSVLYSVDEIRRYLDVHKARMAEAEYVRLRRQSYIRAQFRKAEELEEAAQEIRDELHTEFPFRELHTEFQSHRRTFLTHKVKIKGVKSG